MSDKETCAFCDIVARSWFFSPLGWHWQHSCRVFFGEDKSNTIYEKE